jgi:hypothetical protein
MRSLLFMVAVTAIVASVPKLACGQGQAVEFLDIANNSDQPIKVHIKSRGRTSPSREWQKPREVQPGAVGRIQLVGFQPFDIAIERIGGTFVMMSNVNLCTMMDQCRRGIAWNHDVPAEITYWTTRDDGTKELMTKVADGLKFRASAAANSVQIEYGPTPTSAVGADLPRKPKLPKRPK